MAAFDFPPNAVDPNPPEVGDTYKPPGSDITYQWNGTVWNASVGQSSVGVTLVTGGDGISTSPVAGITETGNVAVDSTVVRTTDAQIINGIKTFADGAYGNTFGGTSTYTSLANGSGTQLGSITAINDTKLTIATTAGAFGAQLVTPNDQYVEVVSGATAYARFNAADTSLRIGGTLATAPNITLNADGSASFSGNVVASNSASAVVGVDAGCYFQPGGVVQATRGGGTNSVFEGYETGNSTPTSTVFSNGSAEFAGDVQIGPWQPNTSVDDQEGIYLGSGAIQSNRTAASRVVLQGRESGTITSKILADGSGEFAGGLTEFTSNGGIISGIIELQGNRFPSSPSAISVRPTDASSGPTVEISTDGSATFNKSVSIGDTNAGTISATNLDAARAYELPNADGTIALTSNISGGAIEFIGDIDVVNDTAPTTPTSAIWVNTQAGNANASFIGLNQQYIALNQLIFLTDNNGWVPGGVTDPATYVTIATNQTISGTKSFTQDIGIGGTLPASPNISLDNDGTATFAGPINAGSSTNTNPFPSVFYSNNTESALYAKNYNAGGAAFTAEALSAQHAFQVDDADGTQETAVINGDGSASFASAIACKDGIRSGPDYSTGAAVITWQGDTTNSQGQLRLTKFGTGSTANLIETSDQCFLVGNDGSAQFAGTITADALSDGTTTKTMTEVLNPPPSVPSGSVFYFAAATAPSGYLQCDGSAVSRTTYADLFAICSTTFGAGDGTSTFNLPDLRGEFIRGFDGGRDVDSGRAFGSTQDSAVDPGDIQVNDPGHSHGASGSGQYPLWATGPAKVTPAPTGQGYRQGSGINVTVNPANTGITIGNPASDADETRPRNVALLPCIKT